MAGNPQLPFLMTSQLQAAEAAALQPTPLHLQQPPPVHLHVDPLHQGPLHHQTQLLPPMGYQPLAAAPGPQQAYAAAAMHGGYMAAGYATLASGGPASNPLYVNPKQLARILCRRSMREKEAERLRQLRATQVGGRNMWGRRRWREERSLTPCAAAAVHRSPATAHGPPRLLPPAAAPQAPQAQRHCRGAAEGPPRAVHEVRAPQQGAQRRLVAVCPCAAPPFVARVGRGLSWLPPPTLSCPAPRLQPLRH